MKILRTFATFSIGCFLLMALFLISMPSGSGQVLALDGPTGPDLVIESLTLQPPNPLTTEPVLIRVRVRNQGDADATGFRTYLYIDPDEQPPTLETPFTTRWGYFFTLPPGEVVEFQYDQYTFPESGCGHLIYAWADRDGQTDEGDETNNLSQIDVCVDYTELGPDAYEPDDECETQAQEILTDGTPQSRNFAPEGDVDWVKFEATEGLTYTITAAATGAESQPLIDVVPACNIGGLGESSRIIYEAQTSGLHYIRLENGPASYNANESTYLLTVHDEPQGVAPQITAIEPDLALNDQETDVVITGTNFLFPPLVELCPYQANSCGSDCTQLLDPTWLTLENLFGTVPANLETGPYCLAITNPEGASELLPNAFTISSGQTASPTPTNQPTNTPTPTNTPPNQPTNTPPNTPIPGSNPYEPNDNCGEATSIGTNGSLQIHTFHDEADSDWLSFDVTEAITYVIEARVPPGSAANVVLELYESCESSGSFENSDPPVNPDIRLIFEASTSGTYYLRLSDKEPSLPPKVGGDRGGASYHLSVRAINETLPSGALILVAGRLRNNDPVQDNIHHVTNSLYQFATTHGCTAEQIAYLATDTQLDGVTGLPNVANLGEAITEWAVDKVDAEHPLTIYLMDHGEVDLLYLDDTISERITPVDLDGWLDQLEAAVPGVKINVIIESCYSGSFIDPLKTVSGPGRVIMTSTSHQALAYASQDGATFSDTFIGAAEQGMSLLGAFEEAKWASVQGHPDQEAWLDDDADNAYTSQDGTLAAQRSLTCAPLLPGQNFPPNIEEVEVREFSGNDGEIWAKVQDDSQVRWAWAIIYPPSYKPPASSNEIVPEPLPVPLLRRDDGDDGWYAIGYDEFDQMGSYRIVVYAEDQPGLQSRPQELLLQTGYQLYLPAVRR